MATELFPIVVTSDLQRSLSFYRDLLGGVVTFEFPGPDGAPAYVALDVGASRVGIGQDPTAIAGGGSVNLWVYADDCDTLVESLRRAGVPVLEEPRDEPWGERVAKVQDPDGVLVHIASRTARS